MQAGDSAKMHECFSVRCCMLPCAKSGIRDMCTAPRAGKPCRLKVKMKTHNWEMYEMESTRCRTDATCTVLHNGETHTHTHGFAVRKPPLSPDRTFIFIFQPTYTGTRRPQ